MGKTTGAVDYKKLRATLWTIQGLLAAVFLFAGVMKLIMPFDELARQSTLPVSFVRFIGLAETLGALGLVLPGLVRIGRSLTPLAAAGLVIIMVGATVITAASGAVGPAVVPFIIGALAAFVAYSRHRVAPLARAS
jgi:hypothetical protein